MTEIHFIILLVGLVATIVYVSLPVEKLRSHVDRNYPGLIDRHEHPIFKLQTWLQDLPDSDATAQRLKAAYKRRCYVGIIFFPILVLIVYLAARFRH